jgi:hypothetical protein
LARHAVRGGAISRFTGRFAAPVDRCHTRNAACLSSKRPGHLVARRATGSGAGRKAFSPANLRLSDDFGTAGSDAP